MEQLSGFHFNEKFLAEPTNKAYREETLTLIVTTVSDEEMKFYNIGTRFPKLLK
jgi:hypothetical protein